jgi:polysaccharide biosynthesis transport protein
MEPIENIPNEASETDAERDAPVPGEQNKLIRLLKSVVYHTAQPGPIDQAMVSPRYYNCFNYSLVANAQQGSNFAIGVTSAKRGEGKTLVAANLAVLLALSSQRKTVVVDLNLHKPRLHEIFGTPLLPGLGDALHNGSISVCPTRIENLFVLGCGHNRQYQLGVESTVEQGDDPGSSTIRLEQTAAFRDVIYSLEQEFEFVIVDMPSIDMPEFPALLAYQLNGILIVAHAGKTRREEIDKIVRQLSQHHILGFVLNHYEEESR